MDTEYGHFHCGKSMDSGEHVWNIDKMTHLVKTKELSACERLTL